MSDQRTRQEYLQAYRALRMRGMPRDEITQRLGAPPAKPAQPQPQAAQAAGPADSGQKGGGVAQKVLAAGIGATQGASLGFFDELMAGMASVFWPSQMGELPGDTLAEKYRHAKGMFGSAEKEIAEREPVAYGAGTLAGGIATAAATGGAATAGGRMAQATGFGAASGAGTSEADLTRGEVGQLARDAATGAAIGGVMGAAGEGVTAGGRALLGKLGGSAGARQATRGLARDVAGELDAPSSMAEGLTTREAIQEGLDVQQAVRQSTGEDFVLRPSQLSGSRKAALGESRTAQFGEFMDKAQAAELRQLRTAERYVEGMVDKMAANPKLLKDASMGRALSDGVGRVLRGMRKRRSEEATPLFKAADEAMNGQPVIQTDNARRVLQELVKKHRMGDGKQLPPRVRKALEDVGAYGDVQWRITASDMQSLMEYWGRVQRGGYKEALGDLGMSQTGRAAKQILNALNDDLAASAQGLKEYRHPAALLMKAREAWNRHSADIDELATKPVKRMLKLGQEENFEAVTAHLEKASQDQLKAVFRVLDKHAPDVAQDARAHLFEGLLTSAGKAKRGALSTRDFGTAKISPKAVMTRIGKLEEKLRAAYDGQPQAMATMNQTLRLMRRLAFGPNLKGAQTTPLASEALEAVTADGLSKIATKSGVAGAAIALARRVFTNDKAMARAMSDVDSMRDFGHMLRASLRGDKLTQKQANAARLGMVRLVSDMSEGGATLGDTDDQRGGVAQRGQP